METILIRSAQAVTIDENITHNFLPWPTTILFNVLRPQFSSIVAPTLLVLLSSMCQVAILAENIIALEVGYDKVQYDIHVGNSNISIL